MILEGCQTIQWRRHFDQIPSLLIFFLRFFLERIQCVSSSTSFRIERFWRNKATCSLFHSCSREHVWCPLPPLSYAPPSYRGEVSFPGFCPRFQTRHLSGGEFLARIRVSDIVWEIPPNFWIAICVLHGGDWSRMILIFWIFSFFVAIINF